MHGCDTHCLILHPQACYLDLRLSVTFRLIYSATIGGGETGIQRRRSPPPPLPQSQRRKTRRKSSAIDPGRAGQPRGVLDERSQVSHVAPCVHEYVRMSNRGREINVAGVSSSQQGCFAWSAQVMDCQSEGEWGQTKRWKMPKSQHLCVIYFRTFTFLCVNGKLTKHRVFLFPPAPCCFISNTFTHYVRSCTVCVQIVSESSEVHIYKQVEKLCFILKCPSGRRNAFFFLGGGP